MLQIIKSENRGFADHGWLKSHHTFSFADYYNPKFMGFRSLRVINEDRIDGGTGFGKHPHRDMEIISYVVKGGLKHEDTMGNKTVIKPGEVQKLSAGTGMLHSEHNEQGTEQTHFFQIWIIPNKTGQPPSYGQKSFEADLKSKKMVLAISQDGRDGSISIQQDADMYISRLNADDTTEFTLRSNRGAWIQIVSGKVKVNDEEVAAGDGIAVENQTSLNFKAAVKSEFLLFDLA
ncbi:MAG: pirin family protein [Bdellovibrionota bacterium]